MPGKNFPGLKSSTMYKVVIRHKGGTVHEHGPYARSGHARSVAKSKKNEMELWNQTNSHHFHQDATFEIWATEVNWVLCDQEEES